MLNFLFRSRPKLVCSLGLALVLFFVHSVPASAGVFGPPEHIFVRNVKPSGGAQLFELGLSFEIAPIRAAAKKLVEQKQAEVPGLEEISDELQNVDLSKVQDLDSLKAEFLASSGQEELTPEQQEAFDQIPAEDYDKVVSLAEVLQADDSLAFSIRPKVALNLSKVRLIAEVPLAGFKLGDQATEFKFGNVNLDMNFGHSFGEADIGFGITYGVHAYFPTGTDKDNTLGKANVLNAPIYFHEFMTVAPYAALGADLFMARATVHGELVPMFGMRGDPRNSEGQAMDNPMYFRYGAGLLVNLLFTTLHGELVGTKNVSAAKDFEGKYAIVGATFGGSILHFGVAAQLKMSEESSQPDGVNMDTNFIATFGVGL